MAWLWLLLICWGCLLGGFVLGAWWTTDPAHGREVDDLIFGRAQQNRIEDLEDELEMLRDIRQAEWRQKLEAGDA
jgi:hypothetical protein